MRKCSCALKNTGGKYFCISHISRGISLFQYLISSLWIYLDESDLQMMQENNIDQQDWGIYNKFPICKTQYVNNLCNKVNKHFHAYKLLLTSCIFQDHVQLVLCCFQSCLGEIKVEHTVKNVNHYWFPNKRKKFTKICTPIFPYT